MMHITFSLTLIFHFLYFFRHLLTCVGLSYSTSIGLEDDDDEDMPTSSILGERYAQPRMRIDLRNALIPANHCY
jgi:hypothetical protein